MQNANAKCKKKQMQKFREIIFLSIVLSRKVDCDSSIMMAGKHQAGAAGPVTSDGRGDKTSGEQSSKSLLDFKTTGIDFQRRKMSLSNSYSSFYLFESKLFCFR